MNSLGFALMGLLAALGLISAMVAAALTIVGGSSRNFWQWTLNAVGAFIGVALLSSVLP